jgi:hypothetical protein
MFTIVGYIHKYKMYMLKKDDFLWIDFANDIMPKNHLKPSILNSLKFFTKTNTPIYSIEEYNSFKKSNTLYMFTDADIKLVLDICKFTCKFANPTYISNTVNFLTTQVNSNTLSPNLETLYINTINYLQSLTFKIPHK